MFGLALFMFWSLIYILDVWIWIAPWSIGTIYHSNALDLDIVLMTYMTTAHA